MFAGLVPVASLLIAVAASGSACDGDEEAQFQFERWYLSEVTQDDPAMPPELVAPVVAALAAPPS